MIDPPQLRFLSPDDPVLYWSVEDPQTFNLYSYVHNNPLNHIDPTGHLTIIVPGTGWSSSNWNDNMKLVNEAKQEFHDPDVRILNWSGDLTNSARLQGASQLSEMVANHTFQPGEKLNVIGHSRGGEVALDATTNLTHKIDNLITLDAVPASDLVPNMDNIGTWINVSVAQDWVLWLYGSPLTDPHQQEGAHNLILSAPQYGHIAAHSAVWQDDRLRELWWNFWSQQNSGNHDWFDWSTNTLHGTP